MRLCGDEITRYGIDDSAGHGRVGQALRQQRIDLHPQHANRFLDALQCYPVGDAQAVVILRAHPALLHLCFDLRPRAMDQHQPDASCLQQVDVLRQHRELAVGHHLATEGNDKGLAAKAVDVGCNGTKPGDKA